MDDKINVTTFAPVFIPTLCRTAHFINLLESLERCTWSEYTEVYVSLDYPPEEKYVEGHRLIDEYLQKKEEKNGFKYLHVFRQKENLGISGSFAFLRHFIAKYDKVIISEDDNVFSPNFLMFINKGLEKYKDDPTVCAINGYTLPYAYKFGDNTFFKFNNDFSAWGYGYFTSRMEAIRSDIENGYFRKSLSLKNVLKVKKHGLIHLKRYLLYCFSRHPQNIRLYDTVLSLYMIVHDMCVICPKVTTVRNEGWDHTGNSRSYVERHYSKSKQMELSKRQMNQCIDTDASFIFEGDPLSFFDYNNKLAAKESMDRITWIELITGLMGAFREYIKK